MKLLATPLLAFALAATAVPARADVEAYVNDARCLAIATLLTGSAKDSKDPEATRHIGLLLGAYYYGRIEGRGSQPLPLDDMAAGINEMFSGHKAAAEATRCRTEMEQLRQHVGQLDRDLQARPELHAPRGPKAGADAGTGDK